MKLVIVDYGVGNLYSVSKAFAFLGCNAVVSSDAVDVEGADKIVLPGVGAFGDCMTHLRGSGLVPALTAKVIDGHAPLLGICVGLQILFDGSDESPGVAGLGWLPGMVRRINAPGLKVPHMGWNSLALTADDPLFHGLGENPYVYFVHSYHARPVDAGAVIATTEYGETLTAAVAHGNLRATQFHPEKSGDVGLAILRNFVEMP